MTQPFLIRIFLKAGWAPFAVLVIFQGIHFFGLRGAPGMDAAIHFLGGASMGFLFQQLLPLASAFIGSLTKFGTAVLSLCLTMSVALFWEFAEFASDQILKTDVQHSVTETMGDLIAGSLGAMLVVLLFALFRRSTPKA